MELFETIEKRTSVRQYSEKTVCEKTLRKILEAGIQAPSARNRQQWRIVVVRDPDRNAKLVAACEQPWMQSAPVILAAVGLTPDQSMFCGIPTDPIDCAIGLDHISLAAVAEGLGTCWIGHFPQGPCKNILGVPDECQIIELMTLGYPGGDPKTEKPRKPFEQIVYFEQFE